MEMKKYAEEFNQYKSNIIVGANNYYYININ